MGNLIGDILWAQDVAEHVSTKVNEEIAECQRTIDYLENWSNDAMQEARDSRKENNELL